MSSRRSSSIRCKFGANEDLARYPRQEEARDAALLVEAWLRPVVRCLPVSGDVSGRFCDQCHAFPVSPTSNSTVPHRPGHFDGVATVVAKLFAAGGSRILLCSAKRTGSNSQSSGAWRHDLDMALEVRRRADRCAKLDGLARSSRNAYLSRRRTGAARNGAAALRSARCRSGDPGGQGTPPALAVAEARARC